MRVSSHFYFRISPLQRPHPPFPFPVFTLMPTSELQKKVNTVKRRHADWVEHLDFVDLRVALSLPERDHLRTEIVQALQRNRDMQEAARRQVVQYAEERRVPVHVPIGKGASVVVWLPPELA